MLIGLPLELSGDFVPVCSQTRDSVGVTVQGVVVVDSREQLGPDATLFHEEKFENQARGRGRFVWIVRFHPD